jgi:hypothetical protein
MAPLPWKWLAPVAVLLVSLLSSSSGAGERGTKVRGSEPQQGAGLVILFPVDGQEICREEDLELICTSNGYTSPRPLLALSRGSSHPHPKHLIFPNLFFAIAPHSPTLARGTNLFFPESSSGAAQRPVWTK